MQRVPILPAVESDKASRKTKKAKYEPSGAPMRCQIWDHRRLVATVPVTFDEMGHPSDVVYTPGETEKFTRLAFIYGGSTYGYPVSCGKAFHPPGEVCGKEMVISPSKPLHLALGHLQLLNKFGQAALKAGR